MKFHSHELYLSSLLLARLGVKSRVMIVVTRGKCLMASQTISVDTGVRVLGCN